MLVMLVLSPWMILSALGVASVECLYGACERTEPEATGLLQAAAQGAAKRELYKGEMTEMTKMTKVAVNYTCAEACAILGGSCVSDLSDLGHCARRRAAADKAWDCSCDAGLSLIGAGNSPDPSAKLSESPFLMTHDSATGYIGASDVRALVAQAQFINLKDQLKCGTRALDLRLVQVGDEIHFHHGDTVIFDLPVYYITDQTLSGELPGLISWAEENPGEFVVMVISHCRLKSGVDLKSKDCMNQQFVEPFTKLGIAVEGDCDKLRDMTLADAKAAGALGNGGHMLAISGDCVVGNWKSSVDSKDKVKPYVKETMSKMQGSGKLFQVQSFIQQKLLVPLSASLNKDIVSWLTDGSDLFEGVNFLEINMVCASGMSMARALGATISAEDAQSCISECKRLCTECDWDHWTW